MIEPYLAELERALVVRGRARRRFTTECREHLADLADEVGDDRARVAFGEPELVAAEFDAEVATRRAIHGAWVACLAVLATGLSTVVLINGADRGVHAVVLWAVVCLGAGQVAAVAAGLTTLQALRLRRDMAAPADAALLARRALVAVIAAGVAMFAAGAAVSGSASAVALLVGPVTGVVAFAAIARSRRLTRQIEGGRVWTDRSPFADFREVSGIAVPQVGPWSVAMLAAAAAFLRDTGEAGSSLSGSVTVAAIEAGLVVLAYVALRGPLGLRALTR